MDNKHSPHTPHTPGIVGSGRRIAFTDVVKTALGHADLVKIGDCDHTDDNIRNLALSRETLLAAAEGGASHLFLEWKQQRQLHADALLDGTLDRNGFVNAMIRDGAGSDNPASREALGKTADTLIDAQRLGMDVYFADPDNGGEQADRYILFENELAEKWDDMSQQQRIDARQSLKQLEHDFNAHRLDDRDLAAFVEQKLSSGKGLMLYGAEHGAQAQDFNEHLQTDSIKIDLYASREAMEEAAHMRRFKNERLGMEIGSDKPELIYIADEQTLYMTSDTPPALASELETLSPEAPSNHREPGQTPQSAPATFTP